MKTLGKIESALSFLLKKYHGKEYSRFIKIYCPFHSEKIPSLYIHKTKLIFHCFGCNASGTLFDLMNLSIRSNFPFNISEYITDFVFENYDDFMLSDLMEKRKISPIFFINRDYSNLYDYFIYANNLLYNFVKKIHTINKEKYFYKIEKLLYMNNITYDLFLKIFPYSFITNYDFKYENYYEEIVNVLNKILINNYLTIPVIKKEKVIGFIQRRISDNKNMIKYNFIFLNDKKSQKYFLFKNYASNHISICEGIFDMLHILSKYRDSGIIISTMGTNNLNIDWYNLTKNYNHIKIYGDFDNAGMQYINYLNKKIKRKRDIENFYILKKTDIKDIVKRGLKFKKYGGAT